MTVKEMREKVEALKNEAKSLVDANKLEEAEAKKKEAEILNAQIEIQTKLEEAESQIENFKNDIKQKDEECASLKSEKEDLMQKYNDATEKVADLTAKVETMQPIVDEYYKAENEKKLNDAKEKYRAKFEKIDGLETFESEEVQNLIAETINENEETSIKAKYSLSEKIMEIIDKRDSGELQVKDIQEPAKDMKNLNVGEDEFEKTYGFKRN